MRLKFLLILLLMGVLSACSIPRIIVLNDPLDARQHNDLGTSYEQREEYDLALREYRRAADLEEEWPLPLFNMGNVHAKQKQWSAAISAYQEVLRLDPQSAQAANNLAWVLVESGDQEKGISLAERAIALDDSSPDYWHTLAAVYLAAGRLKDSQRAARKGLSLEPAQAVRESLQTTLQSGTDLLERQSTVAPME